MISMVTKALGSLDLLPVSNFGLGAVQPCCQSGSGEALTVCEAYE